MKKKVMLSIIEVKKEERDTMMNLLEKYLYEFSLRINSELKLIGIY